MSIISQFYQMPTKSLINPTHKNPFLTSIPPIFSSSPLIPCFSINSISGAKRDTNFQAVSGAGAPAVVGSPATVEVLKKRLIESLNGTDRGLKTSGESRAKIEEIVNELEAMNPNPSLSHSLSLLNGKWIVAYTSFAGVFPLLSVTTLPLFKLDEISETIQSENFTIENSVHFASPLATTSVSTNSKFEIMSPKCVQVKFEEGIIGTPQPNDSTVIPDNVELLGQKIDLSLVKGVVSSMQGTASSVANTISNQLPLKFDISERVKLWILATYIDEELRISRGDAGIVIVFLKEGSPLLSSWSNS